VLCFVFTRHSALAFACQPHVHSARHAIFGKRHVVELYLSETLSSFTIDDAYMMQTWLPVENFFAELREKVMHCRNLLGILRLVGSEVQRSTA